ncbi:MAG: porin [Buchnera aphidicola (Brevicoryne brassicae)]|uniref:Porin n=1 Tax=Buchnera aphidicola (Brevicoryne brassicae) TaxID=911343 RepID=A0AAJ5PUI4_9GAMM|nr:porin [Buchnera aphidicola]QCI19919.1 porin [Buchnera aphidicola (Brevicoryne brassicae)]WAI18742.1 MAG: porin [Buchnera aphidicola (Brevicoryne brassicae)]
MINRKSLAIAIPLLLSASNGVNAVDIFNKNGNKLELYGSLNPNHEFSHKFLSKKIESHNDSTNAILGLSGKINITDELFSYATVEYKTDFFSPEDTVNNKQESNTVRLGYAGFKYGNWGSIDYGRNYGIFHDVESLTNHTPYITKNSAFNNNDSYMIGRNNSLLTYRNNNIFGLFDGISFALQYKDESKNKIVNQENSSTWGASLKYETDVGLTAIGSCFSSERSKYNDKEKNEKIPSINAYGLGFKYDANDIYIAAFYGAGSNLKPFNVNDKNNDPSSESYINKIENIEAIAEYNFHSGFYPSLSYLDSKGQNSNIKQDNFDQNTWELAKQINISTRYEFNKNISTYMNYKINLLKSSNKFIKENNIPTDNIIGAGVVYQF